jgi:hypothetical protein
MEAKTMNDRYRKILGFPVAEPMPPPPPIVEPVAEKPKRKRGDKDAK